MQSLFTSLRSIGFLTIALTIALAANFAYGEWASPPEAPPADNIKAPVNVGTSTQTKTGDLAAWNLSAQMMKSPWYCDENGAGEDDIPGTLDDSCLKTSDIGVGGGGGSGAVRLALCGTGAGPCDQTACLKAGPSYEFVQYIGPTDYDSDGDRYVALCEYRENFFCNAYGCAESADELQVCNAYGCAHDPEDLLKCNEYGCIKVGEPWSSCTAYGCP